MIDERLTTYINSLDTGNKDYLEELEQYAHETYVPVIRREMQSFLKVLLGIKQPEKILEVGTAIGFSTLLMCEYGPEKCQITTIETTRREFRLRWKILKSTGVLTKLHCLPGMRKIS